MGQAGISNFVDMPEKLDAATCKAAIDECFDQEMFDANAEEGKISKSRILELMHSWTPSHVLISHTKTELDTAVGNLLALKLKGLAYDVHTKAKPSTVMTAVVVAADNMRTSQESVDKAALVVIVASNQYCSDVTCYAQAAYANAIGAKIVVVKSHETFHPDGWMKKVCDSAVAVVVASSTDVNEAINVIKKEAGTSGQPKLLTPHSLPNGDKFFGNLKNEKKHGWGKCVYGTPQGRTYEGQMVEDKRHGAGCCIYPNGDIFIGTFVGEKYVGKGIYWYETGDIFEGEYKTGKRDGYGVCKYASGDCYIGHFVIDKYNGKGRYTWVDDAYYEGDYVDDEMHGIGKMVNPDGSVSYDGQWVKGEEGGL